MSNEPLVCVGLTSYDRVVGLKKCLEALLKQTYKNMKINLYVDFSPKQQYVCKYVQDLTSDKRVTVYLNRQRLGMHPNIGQSFKNVTSDYFFWADDDDWHEPTFVEEGVTTLENNKQYNAWFPTMDNVDCHGFVYRKYPSFERFTSTDSFERDITRFIMEPEVRGKCNLMYGIYRTPALRETVNAYFLNDSWGPDNSMMVAFLTRFKIICSKNVLFHKGNFLIKCQSTCYSAEDLEKCNNEFPKNVAGEYLREQVLASAPKYKELVRRLMQERINKCTQIAIQP